MATDRWMQERANRAWEEFGNTLLDYLLILMNMVVLMINTIIIIYRRSERTENNLSGTLRRE